MINLREHLKELELTLQDKQAELKEIENEIDEIRGAIYDVIDALVEQEGYQ